jgi:hypothetical protein
MQSPTALKRTINTRGEPPVRLETFLSSALGRVIVAWEAATKACSPREAALEGS